jgi:hypothetical protein
MSAARQRCYLGFDLGTSCSGYAYALDSNPQNILFPDRYTLKDHMGRAKTDTALLFEELPGGEWSTDCWGTEAVEK